MSGLIDHLRTHGDHVAVVTDGQELTYRVLADQVAAAASSFGTDRRLVLL